MSKIVVLYVLIGIVAFLALIFTVRVRVTIDMADELKLWVTVLGIKINILPKKEKKYKLSNYTLKKIGKRDKKQAARDAKKAEAAALKKKRKAEEKKRKQEAESRLTKEQKKAIKARKKASRPPLPPLVSLLRDTLGFFFPSIFGKFHFHVARIKLKIGGKDAAQTALTYYAVSNALAPTLRFIDKHSNLHGMKTAEIDISPDFLSEEIKADVKLGFSTSLGGILGSVLKTGFKFLFGFMKIKPSAASGEGHNPPKATNEENKTPDQKENGAENKK